MCLLRATNLPLLFYFVLWGTCLTRYVAAVLLCLQSLTFKFTVAGRGGHAAMPHLNIDPVPAAAALVQALQVLVSRETSPLGSAVLSITQLQVRGASRDAFCCLVRVMSGVTADDTTCQVSHLDCRVAHHTVAGAWCAICWCCVRWCCAVIYPITSASCMMLA
jgi:hypothetical protein